MTGFYVRWSAVLVVSIILVFLTYRNYEHHLASLSPKQVSSDAPREPVRVLGLVKAGSLTGELSQGRARFVLIDGQDELSVRYEGPPPENLRELKKLIVIGTWNSQERVFQARDLGLVTNYGFVLSAYLVGLIPLALFLFVMGRKVSLLYEEIKQSKLYQSELDHHVDAK